MNLPGTTSTTPKQPEDASLDLQRAAIAALGHELRTLEITVSTATSAEVLHRVAGEIRRLHGQLTGRRRTPAEIPLEDVFPGGVRMYNPATGPGSPVAPPRRVTAASSATAPSASSTKARRASATAA